jgi:transcriptional regulator with XRE-family HTH domain
MSGLAYKTIYKWYNGESVPTLKAIEAIAEAFGITLSELFAEDDNAVVDNDFKELYKVWKTLTESQQQAVMTVIKSYKND